MCTHTVLMIKKSEFFKTSVSRFMMLNDTCTVSLIIESVLIQIFRPFTILANNQGYRHFATSIFKYTFKLQKIQDQCISKHKIWAQSNSNSKRLNELLIQLLGTNILTAVPARSQISVANSL